MNRRSALAVLVIAVLLATVLWFVNREDDSRFRPSGTAAVIPEASLDFDAYVQQSRSRIRAALATNFFNRDPWPFGEAYPLEQVVNMRAPYELVGEGNDCDNVPRTGFLLLHGLTDSPYLLKPLARDLAARYPCALVRGLLTPGHGTVPGDLLTAGLKDWRQAVAWGIDGFDGVVDKLYVLGYSNGSALVLDYLNTHATPPAMAGVILLSPGLEARNSLTRYAPYLQYVLPWSGREAERDAVKYESLPTHAAAEFYRLTREVTQTDFKPLSVPVMMVMSGDDTTVVPETALDFFCSKVQARRLALWYHSVAGNEPPTRQCAGLEVAEENFAASNVVSLSHVGISMPPDDPHYGARGNYVHCLAYDDTPQLLAQCLNDAAQSVYGELSLRDGTGLYRGKTLRRATFNPDYAGMLGRIICFIDARCGEEPEHDL